MDERQQAQLAIHLPNLIAYGKQVLGQPAELHRLEVTKLTGGYGVQAPYRINQSFRSAEGQFQTVPVVQKRVDETETQVMRALQEVPDAGALPYVIDLFADEQATGPEENAMYWLVTPFYQGAALTFDDEIPAAVIESLARVHVHFASRLALFDGLSGLHRVDAPFFQRTVNNALEALALASPKHTGMAECNKRLEKIGQLSVFEQVLQRLPVTLVHGDVHPGNIIRSPEGESVLIDWGNARIAPAMLDLANVVTLGSDSWAAYFSTWEKAGGPPLDPAQIRREYDWAVAMVNLQYLPFAAAYRNENVPKMVERILDARDRLKA